MDHTPLINTDESLLHRFLRYVEYDTQSDEDSGTSPSTAKQYHLATQLAYELRHLGAEVDYDKEHCYVYAVLPGEEPALGFIAHMDTSPAVSGADVKPRIIDSYDGSDPSLTVDAFPELRNHMGETLIATDGTTLLGADDKAGVAEIMHMVQYFYRHPELSHRTLCIAFTPDEEIGNGTAHFDRSRFPANEAYTVDGGKFGIVEYENFNAAQAKVKIHGTSVHPGSAKDIMINASLVAMEFNGMLPEDQRPEHTEGYEGFFMLDKLSGTVEEASMTYIIRDHNHNQFEEKKELIGSIAETLNCKYGGGVCQVEIHDQYHNMLDVMKDHMHLIQHAFDAIRELGYEPQSLPIRGGTDGAMLTENGLPCPNLCTGGYNFHSRYEYASLPEMERSAELLIRLAKI